MNEASEGPCVEVYNVQESVSFDVERVCKGAQSAVRYCLQEAVQCSALTEIDSLEISIVSDSAIAAIHQEFMEDPTPTDVIAFDYGEIISSADTAKKKALEFGCSVEREIVLYIIHGMLHLAGHRDGTTEESDRMRNLQEQILLKFW